MMQHDENEKDYLLALLWSITKADEFSSTAVCKKIKKSFKEANGARTLLEEYFSQLSAGDFAAAKAEIEQARQEGVGVLSIFDEHYPAGLAGIEDPPLLLFVRGQLPSCLGVAVVGARCCSAYGRTVAYNAARELASRGLPVISGLAYGVDAEAHRGALAGAGASVHPGVAVLGSGLRSIYPRENLSLAHLLLERGGALVSEYGLQSRGARYFFPRRNRIISGLSEAVLVIEASKKSGSLITARLALEQGREVLAVPGPLGSLESEGTNRLISQGAHIFTRTEDLLCVLGEQTKRKLRRQGKKKANKLGVDEVLQRVDLLCDQPLAAKTLLRHLSHKTPVDFEGLANVCDLSVQQLQEFLTKLELEGLLRVLEGERYVLTQAIDS